MSKLAVNDVDESALKSNYKKMLKGRLSFFFVKYSVC